MSAFELHIGEPLASLCRVEPVDRPVVRVAAVQYDHRGAETPGSVADGVTAAAAAGARLVCLPELTLSPYCALVPDGPETIGLHPEPFDGPTVRLLRELAGDLGVWVHGSLWEADPAVAPRGWNTAVAVAPDGSTVRTRKLHIPITAGYFEDRYFVPGDTGYPVHAVADMAVGLPTCWDEWFPEVARAYSLGGAEVLVYPTAIGSEPDHPDFDTMPLWRQVIVANGVTSGLFMVVPNRCGTEQLGEAPAVTFYGSSFISDPFGRVIAEAPRSGRHVIVADLDLSQRRDWLTLFPFLATRRPDTYGALLEAAPRVPPPPDDLLLSP